MSERFVKRTDVDGWPIEDTETGDLFFSLDKSPLVELLNKQQTQLEQAQARIGHLKSACQLIARPVISRY